MGKHWIQDHAFVTPLHGPFKKAIGFVIVKIIGFVPLFNVLADVPLRSPMTELVAGKKDGTLEPKKRHFGAQFNIWTNARKSTCSDLSLSLIYIYLYLYFYFYLYIFYIYIHIKIYIYLCYLFLYVLCSGLKAEFLQGAFRTHLRPVHHALTILAHPVASWKQRVN